MPVVNLNPHKIVVLNHEGQTEYPPAEKPCRIKTEQKLVGWLHATPIFSTVYGEIENLPPPTDYAVDPEYRTFYIVNNLILAALKGSRPDCIAPDTGPTAVRENGQVVAVKQWIR